MNRELREAQADEPAGREQARRLLVVTAWISTACGVLYFAGLMGKLVVDGSIHSESSPAISMVSAAVGLAWDVILVMLFAALRRQIAVKRAVFADLGLIFMAGMAIISSVNWYVQLVLVPTVRQAGEAGTLALIDIHASGSIMYAMEHLAWGLFFGLATIFMAPAIGEGKIESWVRRLLVASGVMSLLYVPGIMIGSQALIDLGYYAAGVVLPVTTALLAVRYRRSAAG